MNRYQIAIRKGKNKAKAVTFEPTDSIGKMVDYIRHCVRNDVIFMAGNMAESVLNAAVISFSKDVGIPILVDDSLRATSLSVAYSHKDVYCPETLPSCCMVVIGYGDKRVCPLPPVRVNVWICTIKELKGAKEE